jgi:hypothetical protein
MKVSQIKSFQKTLNILYEELGPLQTGIDNLKYEMLKELGADIKLHNTWEVNEDFEADPVLVVGEEAGA